MAIRHVSATVRPIDRHKIWLGDAYSPELERQLKFRTAILKNWKTALSPQRFKQSTRKLARWCILALQTGPAVKFQTFKNPGTPPS